VWVHREYFSLNEDGTPQVVAGVPPDYFSATGQRWGNPHYRWDRMQKDGFAWWIERMRTQLRLFDLIRVDHFRGFEAYWEIPADAPTAEAGRWVAAPGEALFDRLSEVFGQLPLVAEDLGTITPEVQALRSRFGLPGMKILQFAFDGSDDNPHLPNRHEPLSVVYTGTHDNDTTLGWFASLSEAKQHYVLEYLESPNEPMPWPMIRTALASVASLAIIPMQDVLELGSGHRLNTPGVAEGNWEWGFQWQEIPDKLVGRLRRLVHFYARD
jgi:4-alpha-glucanotransferase